MVRFSTLLISVVAYLASSALSAQFFTDSILVAAQPEENQFTFEYMLPSGQTGPDAPLLVYAYDNNPVLVYPDGERSFRFDTIMVADFLSDIKRYEDLNGDGYVDVITRLGRVRFGNADGTFSSPQISRLDKVLAFGDWNGDGLTDAFSYKIGRVTGSPGEVYLTTTLRDSAAFVVDTVDRTLGTFEGGGQFAFVNNDTIVDFCYLSGTSSSNTMVCLINDGNGGYTTERQTGGLGDGALIMADFNGDGFDDAVSPVRLFAGINITYNNNGTFVGASPQRIYDGGDEDYYMGPGGAADVDGDGDMDLIVTLKTFASSVYDIAYLLNNGAGFDAPQVIGSFPGFAGTRQVGIQYEIQGIRVLDLNGNGRQDILVNSPLAQITYAFFSTLQPPVAVRNAYPAAEVISVYPNPVSEGAIQLGLPAEIRLKAVLAFTADGRTVAIPNFTGDRTLVVDDLPTGLYTLIVTDSDGHRCQARFVRQ